MWRYGVVAGMLLGPTGCSAEAGCDDEEAAIDTELELSPCELSADLSSTVDNPFFPVPDGRVWTYHGDDEGTAIDLVVTVMPDREMVGDVEAMVVEERESEDGEIVEISINYFAQASDGTVCYLGESVDNYENGQVANHDGSWRADDAGAHAGIQMPATPRAGDGFYQERAPDVAEDRSRILQTDASITVPAGTFSPAVVTHDWNPLETECEVDRKSYGQDVGMLEDEVMKLVEMTG